MSKIRYFIKKIIAAFLAILLTGGISWGQSEKNLAQALSSNLNSGINKNESKNKPEKPKKKKKEFPKSIEARAKSYFLNPDYLFPDKRDPFIPLLSKAKGISDVNFAGTQYPYKSGKETKKDTFKRFGKELKKLKPIPYEFFKRIEKLDPGLYLNLNKYGKLFREKSYLRKVGKNKYFGIVNRYRELIKFANKKAKESPKTPLQTPVKKLKLVGIIWEENNKRALVETPNAKGHSVRPGSLIGANFGVVKDIESDKIVILEKKRNFDGKISSKIDEIRLKQNS